MPLSAADMPRERGRFLPGRPDRYASASAGKNIVMARMRRRLPSSQAEEFYLRALIGLVRSGVPFLVGGAYALREYGGIFRDTKDLDIFCRLGDYPRLLRTLAEGGSTTEITDPTWIAKAFHGDHFVDIIFGSGNARCTVDDLWFRHARRATLFGVSVMLIPPEEMIWTKVYVQDRFRFDGADIAHIIRKQGAHLDWRRLLTRIDRDWELLLAHLVTFRFVYPAERDAVPAWVLWDLCSRLHRQLADPAPGGRVCRGPLLSPHDYQVDMIEWGYLPACGRRRGGANHFQRKVDGANRRTG